MQYEIVHFLWTTNNSSLISYRNVHKLNCFWNILSGSSSNVNHWLCNML